MNDTDDIDDQQRARRLAESIRRSTLRQVTPLIRALDLLLADLQERRGEDGAAEIAALRREMDGLRRLGEAPPAD